MHKNTKRQNVLWASAAVTGAVFAAFVLPTAGAANAAPVASLAQARSGSSGSRGGGAGHLRVGAVGSGNPLSLPINVPVHVCGIAIAILGQADATCAATRAQPAAAVVAAADLGVRWCSGGNQVSLPINLPVSVCGISISVLGKAHASCKGDATTSDATAKAPQEAPPGAAAGRSAEGAGRRAASEFAGRAAQERLRARAGRLVLRPPRVAR